MLATLEEEESYTESDGGSRMDPRTVRSCSGALYIKPFRCLLVRGNQDPAGPPWSPAQSPSWQKVPLWRFALWTVLCASWLASLTKLKPESLCYDLRPLYYPSLVCYFPYIGTTKKTI